MSNIFQSILGKDIVINQVLNGDKTKPFVFGEYKVYSDMPTANKKDHNIIAYDAMFDILNTDVTDWYNTILPTADSTVTLKEFRDSFFSYFGIEQEAVTLVNDSMMVTKTVEPTSISGKTVITAICEINGCFGHIGRDGRFQYIFLKEMVEGLYPSDTLYPRDNLYPADPMNVEQISRSHYISAKYEDFTTARINKLQIRQEEDDIGCIYGTGDNCYIVEDNFLVYGKSAEELQTIAANLYTVICKVWYRPAHVEAKGNPCLEVGDGIKLRTTREIIYTYILQRTLKGIQALHDTYDAEGTQYQRKDVNSVHEDIRQLKGRANKLTRTVEETRSEIVNMEEELSTQIAQNARDILIQAQRGDDMAAQIALNAQQILLKVSKDNIISQINLSAEKALIKAPKIDLVGLVEADELVSKFATITTLNATKAELQDAIIARATIGELNVQKLRVDELELTLDEVVANYVKTNELTANYATIYSVVSIESRIDRLLSESMIVTGHFGIGPIGYFSFKNTSVDWVVVNGVKVLGAVE